VATSSSPFLSQTQGNEDIAAAKPLILEAALGWPPNGGRIQPDFCIRASHMRRADANRGARHILQLRLTEMDGRSRVIKEIVT
jgi:hypothetical protein